MNLDVTSESRSFSSLAAVGTVQGLLLWWLPKAVTQGSWPATSPGAYSAALLLAVFVAPLIYLLSEWTKQIRAWIIIIISALLLCGAGIHYGLHIQPVGVRRINFSSVPFALLLTAFVFLFHAVPFTQIFLTGGRWRPKYQQLFLYTWRNALQLALAALFTGVFWMLLHLWIALFAMIGLRFPKVLFSDDASFSLLVAAIVFAFGFHLAGSADRLLLALRQQVLSLLKWLALVATCILGLFTVALLLRAPALMAEHKHVISATWLLWLAVVTVYLYNAGYQDGQTAEPYPPLAGRLLRYATPLLVLICGIATYALLVRVAAYGLTVSRVWGLLVALISLAYAASYSWAALRPGPWMHSMGSANVLVALILLLALGFLLSPAMAPERLAASSQGRRILHDPGIVQPEVYMALRFDLGVYGTSTLRKLALASNSAAPVRTIAAEALAVDRIEDRYSFTQTHGPSIKLALQPFPGDSAIEDSLRAVITTASRPYRTTTLSGEQDADPVFSEQGIAAEYIVRSSLCAEAKPCPVLFIDLDGDSVPEAVAFLSYSVHVFKKVANQWLPIDSERVVSCRLCSDAKMRRALQTGQYQASESRWKDLLIGGERIVITGRN